ncbi:Coiled-coil domain-containing protein 63 [Papilio xuthus]|uniref:Coiled-coil domain-containing protein 63 n=1 Tax=Papilio xuthus TaxID=66420 RepID=A0A194PRB5_PAPXU|nr:Coiled-coil domain-containing protein 63 [Papilio xuthus]
MEVQPSCNEQANDLEVMKKMEDDHLRLQRQFRMIQADRSNRVKGVHPMFRRQDDLLRRLKKEYNNVSTDLKIAKSGANRKLEEKTKKEVLDSILLREKTQTECENGIILMDQLEGLLQRNNKQTLHLKRLVNSTMGKLEERRVTSEHRLTRTENKLEAAMLRFNAIQCENKKIRTEIEHVLKDRAIFNQAWDKMLNALTKGKKFLTDLFESSTLAYDQRDEWCTKLKSVQEKGRMDQLLQVQEMRDLQKSFDHEMKLYNFLSKKGVIRINAKEEKRMEEQRIAREIQLKEKYSEHVKLLNDINVYTQELDINKIIEGFQHTEQKNFSVYKMLTEYCAENEVLGRDLQRIRQNLEDRKDWIEMMEEKQNNKLKILREELEQKSKITQSLRQKLEMQTQQLNESMEKVYEIFKMLDCSLEPFHNLLGDKRPSFHCLNLTFCLITDRIKELIHTAFYYERHVQKHHGTSRLRTYTVHSELPKFWSAVPINYMVPADPCPSCVEARWMSRVPEELETPLEEDEVLSAITELSTDSAFVRSDRIHPLTECKVPRSRVILARRYMQN